MQHLQWYEGQCDDQSQLQARLRSRLYRQLNVCFASAVTSASAAVRGGSGCALAPMQLGSQVKAADEIQNRTLISMCPAV